MEFQSISQNHQKVTKIMTRPNFTSKIPKACVPFFYENTAESNFNFMKDSNIVALAGPTIFQEELQTLKTEWNERKLADMKRNRD